MSLLGSVLWLLCYRMLPQSPDKNMATIWTKICAAYKKHKVMTQYSALTLNSFVAPEQPTKQYPKLKGKGAEVKDLVLPVMDVWAEHMNKRSEHDQHVLAALRAQVEVQTLLSENATRAILPKQVVSKLQRSMMRMLQEYSVLANYADRNGDLLFSVLPKHHWAYHIGEHAAFVNPRKGNTMIDEDFVGRVKDIVCACVSGTKPHAVPEKVVLKYRLGMRLLLDRLKGERR